MISVSRSGVSTGSEWVKCFDFDSSLVFFSHKTTREERYMSSDPSAGYVLSPQR